MDVSERYEQLIAYLNSNLPAPVEQAESEAGVRQFLGGDPVEVVARLTDTSVTVSEFAGVWESPFTFAMRPRRVGVLNWRRLPENALLAALGALIKGAREARLASIRPARTADAGRRPNTCTTPTPARPAPAGTPSFTDVSSRSLRASRGIRRGRSANASRRERRIS
jgi:hypothetical protein